MTPAIAPQEELLLRLIASWGGYGWQRVGKRYDAIVPPEGRPGIQDPLSALGILVMHGYIENGSPGRPTLTAQGRGFLAERNAFLAFRENGLIAEGSPRATAFSALVHAMAPQAVWFFEAGQYNPGMERISVALDVAAAAIGVDLNPRPPEDERAGLGGGA